MATGKQPTGESEWTVTISDGSTVKLDPEPGLIRRAWSGLLGSVHAVRSKVSDFLKKAWKLGVDDPRKVVHCFKVGLALTLVSLFYYTRPLYDGVGGASMWAVMTVVVIFEFTVGATLYKGFNRAIATFLAGALGIGIHLLARKSGETAEPVIIDASLFLLASAATFSRFIPSIKARFDYGVMIFILTYSLVSVSSYRVDKLLELAQQRAATIAIGCSICLTTSMLVLPVWAGEDLHLLVTRNMDKLANSVEGIVAEFFAEDGSVVGNGKPSQKSQYKCVLNSKASEESLANLARWEPAHGQFSFQHPWKQYLKVGVAMRYCAYCVEALNGSINSEIQAPEFTKKLLSTPCMELSSQASKVLKELANSTKTMTKSSNIYFLVGQMNSAVEELQNALRSLPNQLLAPPLPSQLAPVPVEEETEEKGKSISTASGVPFIEVLPLTTLASLLIEISARIEGVVDAIDALSDLANFKPASDEKPQKTDHPAAADPPPVGAPQGQEAMRALEMV